MSPKIKELVLEGKPVGEIAKVAIEEGMISLRDAALLKFKNGETTFEEMLRVTSSV